MGPVSELNCTLFWVMAVGPRGERGRPPSRGGQLRAEREGAGGPAIPQPHGACTQLRGLGVLWGEGLVAVFVPVAAAGWHRHPCGVGAVIAGCQVAFLK